MDTMELMKQRHSVRQFTDKALDSEAVKALQQEIDACNKESGMHIQLITDEPEAFQAGKPTYGQFKGCRNYLAIVGPKGKDVEAGYYGERVVLKAQAPAGYSFVGWKQTTTASNEVIGKNSIWKYYDKGALSNNNWRAASYNDNAWASGESPLGYKMDGIKTTREMVKR